MVRQPVQKHANPEGTLMIYVEGLIEASEARLHSFLVSTSLAPQTS